MTASRVRNANVRSNMFVFATSARERNPLQIRAKQLAVSGRIRPLMLRAHVAIFARLFRQARRRGRRVQNAHEVTAEALWTEVSGRLQRALQRDGVQDLAGLRSTPVEMTDGEFVLAVPNNFTREWIESHFLSLISAALREPAGSKADVRSTSTRRGWVAAVGRGASGAPPA